MLGEMRLREAPTEQCNLKIVARNAISKGGEDVQGKMQLDSSGLSARDYCNLSPIGIQLRTTLSSKRPISLAVHGEYCS